MLRFHNTGVVKRGANLDVEKNVDDNVSKELDFLMFLAVTHNYRYFHYNYRNFIVLTTYSNLSANKALSAPETVDQDNLIKIYLKK